MSDVMPRSTTMYRHSGRVPLFGWGVSLAILIPLAILAGVIYSGIVVHLPMIKLRGLVTLGYGLALGATVGGVCRFAKYRSHAKVAAMTLFIAALSFYTSWAVHYAWVIQSQAGFSRDVIIAALLGFDPMAIYGWGEYIFQEGLWAKNGNAHKGWEAVLGWVIEAGIVFVAAFMARKSYGNSPFCEDCDQWTVETPELAVLPVSSSDPAWQQVASGNIGAIKRLQLAESSSQYVELQLASCPTCTSSDFLSAIAVSVTINKEGNLEKKESDLFRSMPITAEQKAEILTFAEQMAEAVRIMQEDQEEFEGRGIETEELT